MILEDFSKFKLTETEKTKLYNIMNYYYTCKEQQEAYKKYRETGEKDYATVTYDSAHIYEWKFRDACEEFGLKIEYFISDNEPVDVYLDMIKDFLEGRRL